jgi:hypothetical protein
MTGRPPIQFYLLFLSPVILLFAWHLYFSLCLYAIARKAGLRGLWQAWIPVVNMYLMCRLVEVPGWWTLLCIVPWAGVLPSAWLMVQVPKALGITGPERFLMLVPPANLVYMGYLAFAAKPGRRVAAFESLSQADQFRGHTT